MKPSYLDRTYFRAVTKKEQLMPFYISTIGSHTAQMPIRRENGENHYQILYTLKGYRVCDY